MDLLEAIQIFSRCCETEGSSLRDLAFIPDDRSDKAQLHCNKNCGIFEGRICNNKEPERVNPFEDD